MADPHGRHNPTNRRIANDLATKREVVVAVKNITTPLADALRLLAERVAWLEQPWYVRLWTRLRGAK